MVESSTSTLVRCSFLLSCMLNHPLEVENPSAIKKRICGVTLICHPLMMIFQAINSKGRPIKEKSSRSTNVLLGNHRALTFEELYYFYFFYLYANGFTNMLDEMPPSSICSCFGSTFCTECSVEATLTISGLLFCFLSN